MISRHSKSLESDHTYVVSLDSPACVSGHGGHVSVEKYADGRGHGPAELFFATEEAEDGENLVFHLFENHFPGEEKLQHHRVDLGPKLDVGWVKVLLTPSGIEVCWARGARTTTGSECLYLRGSWVPLSGCSAFSAAFGRSIHYVDNGLLCADPERSGCGYHFDFESAYDTSLNGASGGGTDADTSPGGNTGPTTETNVSYSELTEVSLYLASRSKGCQSPSNTKGAQ